MPQVVVPFSLFLGKKEFYISLFLGKKEFTSLNFEVCHAAASEYL